jgi:hypothetical protein
MKVILNEGIKLNQIILIIIFFITIAYLIYLGNKKNPMSISAAEDIKKMNDHSIASYQT